MSTPENAAETAVTMLSQIASGLQQAYPRPELRGRVEQIQSHITSLVHLIAQLPAEEEREADYQARVLAAYRSGTYRGPSADHGFTHTDAAAQHLASALNGGGQ
jgi:hypothetical protein